MDGSARNLCHFCSKKSACWSIAAVCSSTLPTDTTLGEIGGLDGLKTWLLERQRLFQMRDKLSAEIVPKGVLLMGIPGCGKSLAVKAISSYFQLPLYRVDMIEIFSGRHGKAEGVFVEACRLMEDMAPAVLWFDEIEMGITSTNSGDEQGRIFAFFLTWMQEKTRGLFVAATANRIDLLPAEMIRKGRFDEVFFVDLPLDEERVEIFRIHLTRRGVDASDINLEQLIEFTKGWTGAEIEQCVVSAITKARLADVEVTGHGLIDAGGEDCSAVAHDERADQSHSKLGIRTGCACLSARSRPVTVSDARRGIVAMSDVTGTNPISVDIGRSSPIAGTPSVPRPGRIPIASDPHIIGTRTGGRRIGDHRRRRRPIATYTNSDYDARRGE